MCCFYHRHRRRITELYLFTDAQYDTPTSCIMTLQNATLWVWGPAGGASDTQFRIWARFCTMHLATKFHHPTFNRLEVIVLTNKQTHKQSDVTENIHIALLCYTSTQVGNKSRTLQQLVHQSVKNSPERRLRSSPDLESHIVVNVSSTSNIKPSFIKIGWKNFCRFFAKFEVT